MCGRGAPAAWPLAAHRCVACNSDSAFATLRPPCPNCCCDPESQRSGAPCRVTLVALQVRRPQGPRPQRRVRVKAVLRAGEVAPRVCDRMYQLGVAGAAGHGPHGVRQGEGGAKGRTWTARRI
eukprot:2152-Chlamydomonas_euryale.AAC.1